MFCILLILLAFLQEFFQGAKSKVMQIYFVMLIFLLFSDQISSRGQKSPGGGGANCPMGAPPVEESQTLHVYIFQNANLG